MNKKKFLIILAALMMTVGARALKTDSDGYYLIGSVTDWQEFAALVNNGTNSAANARMTAPVNLGNDQTMVGTAYHPYTGTFDGNEQSLTINYNVTQNYVAPFRYVNGATIRRLLVEGSITTTANYAAGIAGHNTSNTASLIKCMSSVRIVSSSTTYVGSGNTDYHGGLVAEGTVTFTDCLWNGSIDGSSASSSYCGGLLGVGNGTATNCLIVGTFQNVLKLNSVAHGSRSATNTYYLNASDNGYNGGTAVTTTQLANGTITTALQAGRAETVWVQDGDMPTLHIFAVTVAETYTLTDGESFASRHRISVGTLTYARGYNVGKWSSWFVPFAATTNDLSSAGLTAAYINGIHQYDDDEDGAIDRTELEIIKIANGTLRAGTPYLVRAAENYSNLVLNDVMMQSASTIESIHTETAWTAYDFEGSYTEDTSDGLQWSLDNSGNLVLRNSGAKLLPLRWRMTITQKPGAPYDAVAAGARAISIRVIGEENQTTGIRTIYPIEQQTVEKAVFDLLGRQLTTPQRGINIINGKKVILK